MNPDVRYNSPIVNAKNTAFSILMLVFFLADSTFGRAATMRVIELGRERVKQEDYIKTTFNLVINIGVIAKSYTFNIFLSP